MPGPNYYPPEAVRRSNEANLRRHLPTAEGRAWLLAAARRDAEAQVFYCCFRPRAGNIHSIDLGHALGNILALESFARDSEAGVVIEGLHELRLWVRQAEAFCRACWCLFTGLELSPGEVLALGFIHKLGAWGGDPEDEQEIHDAIERHYLGPRTSVWDFLME